MYLPRPLRSRGILSNILYYLSGNMGMKVINLIGTMMVARTLGPSGMGYLVLIMGVNTFINTLFNNGSWQILVSMIPQQDSADQVHSLLKKVLVLDILMALLGFVVANVIFFFVPGLLPPSIRSAQTLLFLYSLTIITDLNGISIGILRGFNHYSLEAGVTLAGSAFKVILIGVGFLLDRGMAWFVMAYMVGQVSMNLGKFGASLVVLGRNGIRILHRDSNSHTYRHVFRMVFMINISTTMRLLSRELVRPLLGYFLTDHEIGLYDMFIRLFNLVTVPHDAGRIATQPRIASLIKDSDWQGFKTLVFRVIKWFMLLDLVTLAFLYGFSDLLVRLVAGSGFMEISGYLFVVQLATLPPMIAAIFVSNVFLARQWVGALTLTNLAGSVFYLVSLAVAVSGFRLDGAVGAYVLYQWFFVIIGTALLVHMYRRENRLQRVS